MKKNLILFIGIFLSVCELQAQSALSVDDFQTKLAASKGSQLLDVRTADEYSGGHLQRSQNIDYRSPEFQEKIKALDKSKPVFVYCLAGSRSAAASEILRKNGFSQVYDMKGGYLKWSSAGKPIEAIASHASASMTLGQYKQMIGSTGVVLIDFYAPWCSPCIKMMPTLNKLSAEYKNKVRIETISYDTQKSLARELGIEEIPAFLLYKNGKLIIRKNGYLEEADFRKMLNSAQ